MHERTFRLQNEISHSAELWVTAVLKHQRTDSERTRIKNMEETFLTIVVVKKQLYLYLKPQMKSLIAVQANSFASLQADPVVIYLQLINT